MVKVNIFMKDEDTIIHSIAISRKSLLELIIIAILLSLGVNLIAAQLLNWLNTNTLVIVLVGAFFCLLSIGYSVFSLLSIRTKQRTYEAFILWEEKTDGIV